MPREALVDVDITVTKISDALGAYRLLQSLPAAELRQLQRDSHADADD